ncbi:MAG TPA: amino acid ABC transporter substrate-binding protein [Candidatus Acidoferrum sp.]|nr:amino acid ABC transporter substrate-binding protein [Candidatus Acidoferrum sp.]
MKTTVRVIAVGLAVAAVGAVVTPVLAQPREIKIGGTMAVTGAFAVEWGPTAKAFMEEWAKMMNERGGVFVKEANAKLPIKLTVYDDGSSPDRAVELYERLATTDKVDFFTGPATSPITIRASTVAEKYGIPMVTAEANSPAIFARGFKWLVGADRPAPQWAEDYYAMAKALMDAGAMPRLKTVAVIQENTPHTMDVGWGGIHRAGIAGLTVVATETVPPNAADFSAIIGKLKALNPDMLYVATWAGTAAAFAKQAFELGLRPKELHIPHSTITDKYYGMVGASIGEGITGTTHEAHFKHGDKDAYFALRKRVGLSGFDAGWTSLRFIALEALTKAIEGAGSLDRAKVMAALRGLKYETLHGPLAFSFGVEVAGKKVDGVGNKSVFPAQWQNGKIEVLWPPEVATAKYRPRPQ